MRGRKEVHRRPTTCAVLVSKARDHVGMGAQRHAAKESLMWGSMRGMRERSVPRTLVSMHGDFAKDVQGANSIGNNASQS